MLLHPWYRVLVSRISNKGSRVGVNTNEGKEDKGGTVPANSATAFDVLVTLDMGEMLSSAKSSGKRAPKPVILAPVTYEALAPFVCKMDSTKCYMVVQCTSSVNVWTLNASY